MTIEVTLKSEYVQQHPVTRNRKLQKRYQWACGYSSACVATKSPKPMVANDTKQKYSDSKKDHSSKGVYTREAHSATKVDATLRHSITQYTLGFQLSRLLSSSSSSDALETHTLIKKKQSTIRVNHFLV